MAVSWTQHRFSGGILALDVTNTVVLRGDRARSFDRFEDAGEIARFADAASRFRAAELGGRQLCAPRPELIAARVVAMRETTDRLFRHAAQAGAIETGHLPAFLAACSAGLKGHAGPVGAAGRPFGDPSSPLAFEAALGLSALSLLSGDWVGRIRICPNCNWLFVDRSRNSSRLWCDMAVCGNRQKAKRHYHRGKAAPEEISNA